MTDRVFATAGDWAVGSDGVQWMLMRRRSDHGEAYWRPVAFVRSERSILARCMREKATGESVAAQLLSGLPDTFELWLSGGRTIKRHNPLTAQ